MANQTKHETSNQKSSTSGTKGSSGQTHKKQGNATNKSAAAKQQKHTQTTKQSGASQKKSQHKDTAAHTKSSGATKDHKQHAETNHGGGGHGGKAESTGKDDATPKPSQKAPTIMVVVGVLVAITVLIVFGQMGWIGGSTSTPQQDMGNNDQPMNSGDMNDESVVMTINGEEITQGEINRLSTQMSSGSGPAPNQSQVMEQVISQTLLLQEAKNRGLEVTRQEAEQELQGLLSQQGMNQQQFQQSLSQQGMTYDEFISQYREQMMVSSLQEQLTQNITVTDQEARTFFENNKAMITSQAGSNVTYEEMSSQIKSYLRQQASSDKLQSLVEDLRAEAEIVRN